MKIVSIALVALKSCHRVEGEVKVIAIGECDIDLVGTKSAIELPCPNSRIN